MLSVPTSNPQSQKYHKKKDHEVGPASNAACAWPNQAVVHVRVHGLFKHCNVAGWSDSCCTFVCICTMNCDRSTDKQTNIKSTYIDKRIQTQVRSEA